MRRLAMGLFTVSFLLAAAPACLRAQGAPSSAEARGDSSHYVPPPAWKSVEIGNFYLRRKDYRGAISRYQEAIHSDRDYAPAYLQLGRVYEKLGRRREALATYRKYLEALPSEKQAQEARDVHKAIRRLESELRHSHPAPQDKSRTAQK